jgi:hypothetical protein
MRAETHPLHGIDPGQRGVSSSLRSGRSRPARPDIQGEPSLPARHRAIIPEVGDRAGEAVTRHNVAMIYRAEGQLGRAVAELERVVSWTARSATPVWRPTPRCSTAYARSWQARTWGAGHHDVGGAVGRKCIACRTDLSFVEVTFDAGVDPRVRLLGQRSACQTSRRVLWQESGGVSKW